MTCKGESIQGGVLSTKEIALTRSLPTSTREFGQMRKKTNIKERKGKRDAELSAAVPIYKPDTQETEAALRRGDHSGLLSILGQKPSLVWLCSKVNSNRTRHISSVLVRAT